MSTSIGGRYDRPRRPSHPTAGGRDRQHPRPRRVGPRVAEWFLGHVRSHGGFDVRSVDLAAVDLPLLDEPDLPGSGSYAHEHTRRWSALVDAADAFVLVTPEYNNGLPAPLKNALDYLKHEWADKPVGFVSYGYSSAGLGAVQMLLPVVTSLRMLPASPKVAVPLRTHLAHGRVSDPEDVLTPSVHALLDDLARLVAVRHPQAAATLAGRA